MLRARFDVPNEDFRPVVWPIPHPYWCSGYGDGYAILIAYVESEAQLLSQWPDARAIDATEVDGIEFSGRFPQPDWWKPAADLDPPMGPPISSCPDLNGDVVRYGTGG